MTVQPLVFECEGSPLVGLLHRARPQATRGVLMVVGGGPQYRLGGHRQLLLWARQLCEAGFHVLRFDYRGMGDSYGDFAGFEHVEQDIAAAIEAFRGQIPGLEDITLWGECDAASAILFCAWRHPCVQGAVLLNPWARTEAVQAKAVLKHYYLQRLRQPSFWRKVFSLRFNPLAAAASAAQQVAKAFSGQPAAAEAKPDHAFSPDRPLPERLLAGLQRFQGRVMLVMSGIDHIAREFDEVSRSSPQWQTAMASPRLTRRDLLEADHTFSSAKDRNLVFDAARGWLDQVEPQQPKESS